MVGSGIALTLGIDDGLDSMSFDSVTASLSSIDCEDDVGRPASGVLAFGAIPFDRASPSFLTIPQRLRVYSSDGPSWETVITGAIPRAHNPGEPILKDRKPCQQDDSSGPELRFVTTDDEFISMISQALGAIRQGQLEKVVLSRQIEVTFHDERLDIGALLRRWRLLEPNCTVFAVPSTECLFMGASPELLVSRRGEAVVSRPLAGTTDGSINLLHSPKDTKEHRLVVNAITDALSPFCISLDIPKAPSLVQLRSVYHLGTEIRGLLNPPNAVRSLPTVLDLVKALHPTPAVGGVPTDEALRLIAELEPANRGNYAGAVGWIDSSGDGEWVVGIRALELTQREPGSNAIDHDVARLAAGVGLIAESEPEAELREATMKLSAVLSVLRPDSLVW
jgi:menaquinone-specific isochorismate synthase